MLCLPNILELGSLAFQVCFFKRNNFIYIWLWWVFAAPGLSSHCREWGPLSSCGSRAFHCDGFCCCRAWGLGREGFSRCVSWAQEHRFSSCGAWAWWSTTFGIFLDQELNPHLLCWQADSLSLSHQGRPQVCLCHAHEPSSFSRMKSPIGVRM